MAAEIIANELKLDLFRIDLSTVVSKYVGETEKNLRLVFDSAKMVVFYFLMRQMRCLAKEAK